MYSFYGGRPGNPFVIVATFGSVHDMEEAFKQGPNYTDVHYGEHVLINTENKNDITNGQIYRRGYDFNNDAGGAEYVGTIVGPAGKAPIVRMTTQAAVEEMYSTTFDHQYPERYSMGVYKPDNSSLVPGKTDSGYNDVISWSCYSVRDQNGEDTTAYIGFTIPYPVIEFNANSVSSYNAPYAIRTDGKNHPFYEKWTLGIPKGVKGDSINRIWIADEDDDSNTPSHYKIYYTTMDYSDSSAGVESQAYELGDYNMIEGISLNDNGTFTITCFNSDLNITKTLEWVTGIEVLPDGNLKVRYNTGNEQAINPNNPIKYIQEIEMDEDHGTITVTYNTMSSTNPGEHEADVVNANSPIRYIKNLSMDSDDGTIVATYNTKVPVNPADPESEMRDESYIINPDNPIKFIERIQIPQSNSSNLVIYYNTGDNQTLENVMKAISNIQISNNGTLTITYNTYVPVVDEIGEETGQVVRETQSFNNVFKSIRSIQDDEQGNLIINYNTLETETLTGALDVPKTIEMNEDQQLKVTYKSGSSNIISDPINFIRNVAIDSQGRLLMKFSDPNISGTKITWNGDNNWIYIGTVSGQGLGFNENEAGATNKYLSGIINTQDQLVFDLNTNRFLSKNISAITVQSGSIKVYNKNSTDYSTPLASITINQTGSSHTSTITSNLFGLHCIFDTITSTSVQNVIPVDILIEDIQFSFTISGGGSSTAIEDRVTNLETSVQALGETLNNKQNEISGNAPDSSSVKVLVSADNSGKIQYSNVKVDDLNNLSRITHLNANKVLVSNSGGDLDVSSVTSTQLDCLTGVTGNIQQQLNSKGSGIRNSFSNSYPSTASGGSGYPASGTINNNAWTTVHKIELTAGASYLLIGTVSFDQTNGNGVRSCMFSQLPGSGGSGDSSNSQYRINRFCYIQNIANANGYTRLRIPFAHAASVPQGSTATQQTVYFNIFQDSGRALTYENVGVQIIRLA